MRWHHYLATIYGAGVLVMPIYQCSRSVGQIIAWGLAVLVAFGGLVYFYGTRQPGGN